MLSQIESADSLQEAKLVSWEEQSELTRLLAVNPLEVIQSTPEVWRVFNTPEQLAINAVGCGDEGLGPVIGCRSHMPGAGILRNPYELVNQMLSSGITGIVTHDNCAAAKLAQQRYGLSIDDWIANIEKLSDNRISRIGHVTKEKMARPEKNHIASMILVRAMRRVRFSNAKGLPLPFNVDAKTCTSHIPEDLLVYLDIAMSESGFGSFFTPERPLVIMIIGRSPFSKKEGLRFADINGSIRWMFENRNDFKKYRRDYDRGVITITGFDPPPELVDPNLKDTTETC